MTIRIEYETQMREVVVMSKNLKEIDHVGTPILVRRFLQLLVVNMDMPLSEITDIETISRYSVDGWTGYILKLAQK